MAAGLAACDDHGDLVVRHGDVLFKCYIVEQLLDIDGNWTIAVATHSHDAVNRGRARTTVAGALEPATTTCATSSCARSAR